MIWDTLVGSIFSAENAGMIGYIVLGAIIVGSTTVSLLGRWETRRDISNGRPSYISVGDYTGIWDRTKLSEICGPPDREDCYTVESSVIRSRPKSFGLRFLDSWILDVGCIAGSIVSMGLLMLQKPFGPLILAICAAYQVAGWAARIYAALKLAQ